MDDVFSIGVGQIGMAVEDLLNLTWHEFGLVVEGYRDRQMIQVKAGWEQARMIAYYTALPHKKKGKVLKMQDIARFEWDTDAEEVKQRLKQTKFDKIFRKDIDISKINGKAG